jgi:putative serine protease PepD
MSFSRPPSRTVATLFAALLVGAGGGAGAALALDDGAAGSTRVVTSTQGATAVAADSTSMTVNEVYRRAKQGVVDVTVTSQGASGSTTDPFGTPTPGSGASTAEGSGIVLDKEGNIATNQHVVDGADTIEVRFADGTKASAKVVGEDASTDVAVIRVSGVDQSELHPLTLGDSSKAVVGNGVIAIGSPYGLEGSVTAGVVSALGRSITSPNHQTFTGAIQTDAPINHGSSGGPLLDLQGKVIGMNAQLESDSGENTGVGFAIPSNTVKSMAERILASAAATPR